MDNQNKKHLTDHQKIRALFNWIIKRIVIPECEHKIFISHKSISIYYDGAPKDCEFILLTLDREELQIMGDRIRITSKFPIANFNIDDYLREYKKQVMIDIKTRALEKRMKRAEEIKRNLETIDLLNISKAGEIISQVAEELKKEAEE